MKPVLVVHGVANRDRKQFENQVEELARAVALDSVRFIPVFWGDLGATATRDLLDTLPPFDRQDVRSTEPLDSALAIAMLHAEHGDAGFAVRSDEERVDTIASAAAGVIGDSSMVRDSSGAETAIREAVAEELPGTRYLREISDPAVLAAVGRALGAAARPIEETPEESPFITRGGEPTRGLLDPVKTMTKELLHHIDRAIGGAIENVAGSLNSAIRQRYAEPVARFLGDVLVYQRKQAAIQARVTEAIAQSAPGFGTEDNPIDVVAHSLGGVVSVDTALRPSDPLYVRSLLTFGSQSSFFQVMDPRPGIALYAGGAPVVLPKTIKSWINLWNTGDPLAFFAGKVYRLADGQPPTDVRIEHLATYGLDMHGGYWRSAELIANIRQALGPEDAGRLSAAPA